MSERWEELTSQEQQLAYQLEEVNQYRYQAELLLGEVESYTSTPFYAEDNLWEAAFQSRYRGALEEQHEMIRHRKQGLLESFLKGVETLKREEALLEEKMDIISYEKQRESWL